MRTLRIATTALRKAMLEQGHRLPAKCTGTVSGGCSCICPHCGLVGFVTVTPGMDDGHFTTSGAALRVPCDERYVG